jgi:AcrR family transcriptional regulator
MDRAQTAIVSGVGRCLAENGARRSTMIDIAAAAGIAKGTLYNHVRTKSEAFVLYADAEIARLSELLVVDGLVAAATAVAEDPVVARMRAHEPAALATALLSAPADAARVRVLEALDDLVGPSLAPIVLRWLLSLLMVPGSTDSRATEAAALGVLERGASTD